LWTLEGLLGGGGYEQKKTILLAAEWLRFKSFCQRKLAFSLT